MKVTLDPQDIPPLASIDDSDEKERRLWFDYLKSINDQRLQTNRSTGFTTYALLGVLAGLLYSFVPRIPDLCARPGALDASLISTVLSGDLIFFFSAVYFAFLAYCQGNEPARALPATKGRAMGFLLWVTTLIGSAFGGFHWWLALTVSLPNRFVKYSIAGIGTWWFVAMLGWLAVFDWSTRRSRALKIRPLMPHSFGAIFTDSKQMLGTAVFCFLQGLFSTTVLFTYLRKSKIRWLDSTATAAITLTVLAIVGILLLRGVQKTTSGGYESLQRDILLEKLSAKEIRARFIRDTLGGDVSAWLDELLSAAKSEDDRLRLVCVAVGKQLEEIKAINPSYQFERTSRASKAVAELEEPVREYRSRTDVLRRQLKQLIDANKAEQDQQALQQWLKDMRPKAEQAEDLLEFAERLLTELRQI
jgi:hypothetical protein